MSASQNLKNQRFAKKLTELIQDAMPCVEATRYTESGHAAAVAIAAKCAPILKAEFNAMRHELAAAAPKAEA